MEEISLPRMRELEAKAVEHGETILSLMEKAGRECAHIIKLKFGHNKNVLVFCGPGNNGGDGIACGRHLSRHNNVSIVLAARPKTEAARVNLDMARNAGIEVIGLDEAWERECDIIIDALLGVGARGAIRGHIREACRIINAKKAHKVSIDAPTGLDLVTGECDPEAVKPDATICLHAPKSGQIHAGTEKTGKLWVADIGLKP